MGKKIKKLKTFFKLYTSGINRREIEQLLNHDAVGAYSYLKSKTILERGKTGGNRLSNFLFSSKEIFISFILQLTPARRLLYGLALIAFIRGLIRSEGLYLIGSFLTLSYLLALELVDKLSTRDELEIAHEIQINLQPVHFPDFKSLSVASFSKPARLVGGDFFDVVQPDPDHVLGILGDVSGKGIPAALYAAYVQSMFISLSEIHASPADLLSSLNHFMLPRLRNGEFITALVACFDLRDRSVTIARAGHNWPLHYCSQTRQLHEIKPKGISIGLSDRTVFRSLLEEQKIPLGQGDLLLLYSDGITEAANPNQQMFELAGLKTVVEENVNESSETIVQLVDARLHRFLDGDEFQDDATMLAIKVK